MQLIVLGMHRAGTSSVARLLNMMGAYFAPERGSSPTKAALTATEDNPKGYWERWDVVHTNEEIMQAMGLAWDRISTFSAEQITPELITRFKPDVQDIISGLDGYRPWMIKDPRLSITLPVWLPLLEVPVFLFVHRSPIQVAQSLHKRDGISIPAGLALWEKYTLHALQATQGHPRIIISYEQLMREPIASTLHLYEQLTALGIHGLHLPAEREILAFIDPQLYRQQGDSTLQRGYVNYCQWQLIQWFEDNSIFVKSVPSLSQGAVEALQRYENQQAIAEEHALEQQKTIAKHVASLQDSQDSVQALTQELNQLKQVAQQQAMVLPQLKQHLAEKEQYIQQQVEFIQRLQAQQQTAHYQYDSLKEQHHLELNQLAEKIHHLHDNYQSQLMQVKQQFDALQADYNALQNRYKQQDQTIGELTANTRRQAHHVERLNHWVNSLGVNIQATFESLTWKIGNTATQAILALMLKKQGLTAKDSIQRVLTEIADWRSRFQTQQAGLNFQETVHNPRDYARWFSTYDELTPTLEEQAKQFVAQWINPPLISIIMPTYNTPEAFLREAIESVIQQIYPHWELCIADDASPKSHVREILAEYAAKDARIKVVYREKNGHIAAASNSALALATGEFIGFIDHDDQLAKHALFWVAKDILENPEAMLWYSDEDKINEENDRYDVHFKPDWNPDLFLCYNFVNHLAVYRASLIQQVGGLRTGYDGAQDYDLVLRLLPLLKTEQIRHIPHVLYHWRAIAGSTAVSSDEKPYAQIAAQKAIQAYLDGQGINATVIDAPELKGANRVKYGLPEKLPLVSLLIPTFNGLNVLKVCIDSILEKTAYPAYEIIIVDNNSNDADTLDYLQALADSGKARIIRYPKPFNYSAINNLAAEYANGSLIGLLNNDLEVISPDWLGEMVGHALRPEVGIVGARLWYPNNTLQHGGVIVALGGVAGHSHKYFPKNDAGYFGRAVLQQNFSAVTGACMIMRKEVYFAVGGLDAKNLRIAFNDVDFCLRVREKLGLWNVWTPYAELYHHESISRGKEDTPEKIQRFQSEMDYMKQRWAYSYLGEPPNDPAYNPNLTVVTEDFALAWPPRVSGLLPTILHSRDKSYVKQSVLITETSDNPVATTVATPQPSEDLFILPPPPTLDALLTAELESLNTLTQYKGHKPPQRLPIASLIHRNAGYQLLHGQGLEIGALHLPALLPDTCELVYADAISREQAQQIFSELNPAELVTVDYVLDLDKDGLGMFPRQSFDFVICAGVLEDTANPIKALRGIFRVLKTGGYAVLAVPDKRYGSDKNRELTPFSHLLQAYQENVCAVTDTQYLDFFKHIHADVFNNTRREEELAEHLAHVRRRRENVQVWDSLSFEHCLRQTLEILDIQAIPVYTHTGDENQLEYFAVWQKQN
ncbi:putative glycosyltransferase [Beggiatoa alba B18LD]|uniref:Putative glycosyltransferase n=1 Tax=Beggiatoa alba B18LD TaxID=395493 RepID=I3CDC2_9GAMM|nr:glycosyltransferase [Beggiatoa alba]EIJ41615.1 putative glycosyltransferase [Beggiatoa alba B18LD]